MAAEPADVDMPQVAGEVVNPALSEVHSRAVQLLSEKMGKDPANPQFHDVQHFMQETFGKREGELAALLQEVERQHLLVVEASVERMARPHQKIVPPHPPRAALGQAANHSSHELKLWQIGYSESASVKGASSLASVMDCLKGALLGKGCMTHEFPIQILFEFMGGQVGQPVEDFSVGVSIGFAVVTSCYLVCLCASWQKWHELEFANPADKVELSERVLRCLQLTTVYKPAATLKEQVLTTIGDKMGASSRPRPNPAQLNYAFGRVVTARKGQGTRLTEYQLLKDVMLDHNRAEPISKRRVNQDEMNASLFLSQRSPEYMDVLKLIWGQEKPQFTALPVRHLVQPYLLTSPVTAAENPVWSEILKPTEEKHIQWLRRLHGKWAANLALATSSRSGPNVRASHASNRDTDYEQVWRICCCWVHAQPVAVSNLPEAELKALQAQFNRGALDGTFAPHVIGMRQEFRSTDVQCFRSAHSGDAQLEEDQHVARMNSAEQEAQLAEFNLFKENLRHDQLLFTRVLVAVSEYENASHAEITSMRRRLADVQHAVGRHVLDAHFAVSTAEGLDEARNFMALQLNALADQHPPCPKTDVMVCEWWNLPMLGLRASCSVKDLVNSCLRGAAESPRTWAAVIFAPNTPDHGKGQATGLDFSKMVQAHAASLRAALNAHAALLVTECHVIFESESVPTDRPHVQDLLLVMAAQARPDGKELTCLFAQSSLARRRTLATPVKSFPRGSTSDWTREFCDFAALQTPDFRRQFASGVSLLQGVLAGLLQGVPLRHSKCLVQDMTLYDDQCASAVLGLRRPGVQESRSVGYTGVAWNGIERRKDIVVANRVRGDLLLACVKEVRCP